MSSFKKLRLDPELPARGQPGANDSGGRIFLDGSSFSSSTSGGSGTYGRNPSGPFRTRYSQPLGAPSPNSTSFSRFAPYYFGKERRTSLRVPLIRARRDDSDSEGQRPSSRASLNSSIGGDSTASATSSTAQRIIETLQNLSTPVMNAGKIRIDQDIKAVQPIPFGGVSPLSRSSHGSALNRSTGPPKMCSSLLLSNPSPANQTSPMFNPGDQRRLFCIPRMVDAATNTDKEEVSSPSQTIFSSKPVTPPANAKSQLTGASNLKPVESTVSSKDDNSEEEFHECSSDFTFSSPWAPNVFDRFLASGKDDKSANKGPIGVQQRVINGYNKDAPTASSFGAPQFSTKGISSFSGSTGSSPQFSLNSKLSPTPGFLGTGSTGAVGLGSSPLKESPFGKSPLNKSFESKSDAPKSFESGNIGSSTVTSETKKSGSGFTGFSFGKPASSPLKTSESSKPFSFGSPVATNDSKSTGSLPTDNVDAPKTESPIPAKSSFGGSNSSNAANNSTPLPPLNSLNKPSSSKWRCSTCMVENDTSVAVCVCCGEKNASAVAPKLAPSTEKKKWRCPTCMVENDLGAASCACCAEKNPNSLSAPPAVSEVLNKKWRCPTCMVENDSAVANCVCCSEKNPNPVNSKKDSSAAGGTAPPASTFKFGISSSVSSSTAPASSGSFVFGAPAQSDIQKPPVSNFQFGVPSTTNSLTPISSTTAVSSSTLPTSSTSSTTTTFKFGSTVQSPTPTATFGFNATAATTSSTPIAVNTPTTTSTMFSAAPKVPESNSGGSTGAAGLFGTSSFQTSQSTPSNSSFKFGSTSTPATNDAQKPSAPPTFSFGASPGTKPAFNNFSFGERPQNPTSGLSGATPSMLTPAPPAAAPIPAPTLGGTPNSFSFGASNPAPSPFGQLQPANPTPSPGGLFAFGGGASSNPPPTSLTPSPAPSFSLTPNLNFGSTPGSSIPFGNPTLPTPNAGSQPPPTLFQFNSTPSDSPAGRKIKKAVRRFNK